MNVVKASNGSLNITDSKQGVLIKAPRDIKAAVETCVYTIEQLEELTAEIAATIPEEKKDEPKKAKGNGGGGEGNDGGDGAGSNGSNVMFSQEEFAVSCHWPDKSTTPITSSMSYSRTG